MTYPSAHQPSEDFALAADAADPLSTYRERFCIPTRPDGKPVIYFCGHSLGLQPKTTQALMEKELENWATLGVDGHFEGETPWYTYPELVREAAARLVGGRPSEVILMNSLTVNLHLMMVTFFRPTAGRFRILIDEPPFPSDLYALQSQLRFHGVDVAESLLTIQPRAGEQLIRMEDIEQMILDRGNEIALVFLNGVNFLTGQVFDMERITAAAKERGCMVGYDLAHAAGNVPLRLHDWDVDFAVWCTYKYLNCGPGAVAGCFVHERHGRNIHLPRLAGWWGNDPATRFRMQLERQFVPQPGADGWQLSNPPIFSLVPMRASLALFHEVGMPALRAKSECLTGYLEYLVDRLPRRDFQSITPRPPTERGCQLSIQVREAHKLLEAFRANGVLFDFRQPDVIRIAPVPFYNTFHEVYQFSKILATGVEHEQ
jgi:kynureninase